MYSSLYEPPAAVVTRIEKLPSLPNKTNSQNYSYYYNYYGQHKLLGKKLEVFVDRQKIAF